jgi:hypothetical protein
MNNKSLINTYSKANELFTELTELLDEVAELQKSPDELQSLDSEQLAQAMLEKKKQLKLTFEDLGLQTELSESTIRRVITAPETTTLSNFLKVAKELGIKTWFER